MPKCRHHKNLSSALENTNQFQNNDLSLVNLCWNIFTVSYLTPSLYCLIDFFKICISILTKTNFVTWSPVLSYTGQMHSKMILLLEEIEDDLSVVILTSTVSTAISSFDKKSSGSHYELFFDLTATFCTSITKKFLNMVLVLIIWLKFFLTIDF